MDKEISRLEINGRLYMGRIKKRSAILGRIVFEKNWVSFWPTNASIPSFNFNSGNVPEIKMTPNGFNFSFQGTKYAFIPESSREVGVDGIFMDPVVSSREVFFTKILSEDSELESFKSLARNAGFKTVDHGIMHNLKLNLILFFVLIFSSCFATILWKIVF